MTQTTNANLNQRHVLSLSGENRAAGLSLNGNHTLSRCFGLEMPTGAQFGNGFTDPANPDYDRGHCGEERSRRN